jgi:uracil-DNA glycosylase
VDVVDKYGGANLPAANGNNAQAGVGRGLVWLAWGAWAAKRMEKLSKACLFSLGLLNSRLPLE